MLDLYLLKTFLKVAACGSFSEAAQQLFLSQPTISKHMGRLEKQLGTALIVRTTHKFQLTPAGQKLAEEGPALLERAEALERAVIEANVRAGEFLLIATETFPELNLLDFFDAFQMGRPDLRCTFSHLYFDAVLEGVVSGRFDIGFVRSFELTEELPSIKVMLLKKNEMGLLVSRRHPLAKQTSVRLADLHDETFLFLDLHRNFHHSIFYEAAEKAHSRIADDLPATLDDLLFLVGQNRGVTLSGGSLTSFYSGRDICFLPIEDLDTGYYISAIYSGKNEKPGLQAMLDALKAYFA